MNHIAEMCSRGREPRGTNLFEECDRCRWFHLTAVHLTVDLTVTETLHIS